MANKHMKRCSILLIIRKMQITVRYHLIPVRVAIIKKSQAINAGEDVEKRHLHCWWECKLIQPLWRTVWRFLKKLRIKLPGLLLLISDFVFYLLEKKKLWKGTALSPSVFGTRNSCMEDSFSVNWWGTWFQDDWSTLYLLRTLFLSLLHQIHLRSSHIRSWRLKTLDSAPPYHHNLCPHQSDSFFLDKSQRKGFSLSSSRVSLLCYLTVSFYRLIFRLQMLTFSYVL